MSLSTPVARYPHFERMSWVENYNMTDLPKSPFQVNFFRWQHFEIAFYEFYLSTLVARYPQFESRRQHDTDCSHWLTNFCWSLHTSGRLSGSLVFIIVITIVITLSLLVHLSSLSVYSVPVPISRIKALSPTKTSPIYELGTLIRECLHKLINKMGMQSECFFLPVELVSERN